jgi:hypothetical protein
VDSRFEAWRAWMRFRGMVPTNLDGQIYRVRQELTNLPGQDISDSSQFVVLIQRLDALKKDEGR